MQGFTPSLFEFFVQPDGSKYPYPVIAPADREGGKYMVGALLHCHPCSWPCSQQLLTRGSAGTEISLASRLVTALRCCRRW
jgi:hypothetical protein